MGSKLYWTAVGYDIVLLLAFWLPDIPPLSDDDSHRRPCPIQTSAGMVLAHGPHPTICVRIRYGSWLGWCLPMALISPLCSYPIWQPWPGLDMVIYHPHMFSHNGYVPGTSAQIHYDWTYVHDEWRLVWAWRAAILITNAMVGSRPWASIIQDKVHINYDCNGGITHQVICDQGYDPNFIWICI